ncbi:MAG: VWA domain-containing protein, partial [Chloroflexota bacterium]
MIRRLLLALLCIAIAGVTVAAVASQQDESTQSPVLDITGVNASELPTALITVNVFDPFGQPLPDLTAADFTLSGDLAERAQIVNVQNVTDDDLPISVVLMIDTSSSMAGEPIEAARAAARLFIENLGPEDTVAVMTFDSQVRTVVDFTSDKDALLAAIDDLRFGGQTALYDAGLSAIAKAAEAPTPRRTVVLLGDGSEYGGIGTDGRVAQASTAERGGALALARVRGVPVYTIGLGFGADRTYLRELAQGTNARLYESPTPQELNDIYSDIANLLRTQYIVTLNADLPLDGTEYEIALQAETPAGPTNVDTAVLRAPIPVPIINLTGLPDTPIIEPTVVELNIAADDAIEARTLEISGGPDAVSMTVDPAEFEDTYTIDPRQFAPGDYELRYSVTDADGDTSEATTSFEIGAVPSQFSVTGIEPGQTFEAMFGPDDALTFDVDVTFSQTPVTAVTVTVDGEEVARQTDAPFSFALPFLETFTTGQQTVTVTVETASGTITSQSIDITVTIVPTPTPTFTPSPTLTPTPTVDVQATVDAQATATAAFAAAATGTAQAVASADAGTATAQAQATADAQTTANAVASVTAGAAAMLTSTAEAVAALTATAEAQATGTAAAAVTTTAEFEDIMTSTAEAAAATATASAPLTATAQAEAEAEAAAIDNETATAQAEANATAQAEAQASRTAEAETETAMIGSVMTMEAATAQAAEAANATSTAQVREAATATAQAASNATATAEVEEAANATATAEAEEAANATATAEAEEAANATATAEA